MMPLVRLAKAEGGAAGAEVLIRSRRKGINDLVWFHCQQAFEKLLKAILQAADIRFPKTPVFADLPALLGATEPLCLSLVDALHALQSYAVETRYPGRAAGRQQARDALSIMVRESFGLDAGRSGRLRVRTRSRK